MNKAIMPVKLSFNISNLNSSEKFVKFYFNEDTENFDFPFKFKEFTSNMFDAENLSKEETNESLKRMKKYLEIHIENEIPKEIDQIRQRVKEKYKIDDIQKVIDKKEKKDENK